MAYHDIQEIAAAGNDIFVLGSNGLFQYNLNDQSVTTYDKVNGLNDTYISHIAWCQQARRLVIVYSNSNIDLLETNGKIINISDLYNKVTTFDKTIHSIYISGEYAYMATGFGVMKVNVAHAEVSESYILNVDIDRVAFSGNKILARLADNSSQAMTADTGSNLINKNNWTRTTDFDAALFDEDRSDYNQYYSIVSTLNTDGPKYNYFYEMRVLNNRLYTVGGAYYTLVDRNYPGIVQVFDGNDWQIYEERLDTITGYEYVDNDCIDVDPADPDHVFVGGRTGLYEFKDGKLVKNYSRDNTELLKGASVRNNSGIYYELENNYVLVEGVKFDSEGNLWVLNSNANGSALLKLTRDGEWENHTKSVLLNDYGNSMNTMRQPIIDSRGLLWFVNDHWIRPSLVCYDMQNKGIEVYEIEKLINQDGTNYTITSVHCVAEDLDGNLWIGTNQGAFVLNKSNIGQGGGSNVVFEQIKVPRNDGSDYADYLLSGIDVSSIVFDAGGRKWIGTNGNGVYLISADNYTQVHHFTATDSKLLSDNIYSIAIDHASGQVFFATDQGLCSYMSDATEITTEMTQDNVYAYPNPVTPDYSGLITVVGLTLNADVKILSASGKLIAEGRSNGGTFTWDGCDRQGRRVATGVYMVVTATADGKKGTVCKIAIVN